MITESTKNNLRRKSQYIDRVQLYKDQPLFSWIDINLTELCNRKCVFCPRVDEENYPNLPLHFSLELADKLASELVAINYQGAVVFCGFGEPLLHPDLNNIIARFASSTRLEIVTNGDHLTPQKIHELNEVGIDYFVVSMYDGPEQLDTFSRMFSSAGFDENYYVLRDRWHSKADGFGLKLTNRAGTIATGVQEVIPKNHPCYYTLYSMTIDWNGDVLLCVQDWNKKLKFGNLSQQTLHEIWTSKSFDKIRRRLARGERSKSPCNKCNADGTLHGFKHIESWNNCWNINSSELIERKE